MTALSRLIIEPCPARPRAVSRIQAMPFSAASIEVEPPAADGGAEAADLADGLGAGRELVAVPASTQHLGALVAAGLLVGGEAEHDRAVGHRGPARARARTTESSIASKSFMSTAPRPQT